jgi:uncharacterized protein (DUF58 family)
MRRIAGAIVAAVLLVVLGAETVTAQETADLQITKVASSKTVRVGETVTYTVRLTNLGPGVVTGVVGVRPHVSVWVRPHVSASAG